MQFHLFFLLKFAPNSTSIFFLSIYIVALVIIKLINISGIFKNINGRLLLSLQEECSIENVMDWYKSGKEILGMFFWLGMNLNFNYSFYNLKKIWSIISFYKCRIVRRRAVIIIIGLIRPCALDRKL